MLRRKEASSGVISRTLKIYRQLGILSCTYIGSRGFLHSLEYKQLIIERNTKEIPNSKEKWNVKGLLES